MAPHSNALTAAFFFIAAIVSDALTAIDSTNHADVPASLRGTSLALVCAFAAPVLIRPEIRICCLRVYGNLQRPIIGASLLAAALLGVHHGGVQTRVFDALYTTLACFAITYLFSNGGVDEAARASHKGGQIDKAVSTSCAMLAGALLLYGSMRILRTGLRHSAEVSDFRVSPSGDHNASSAIRTLGYAYASDVATVSVSFAGAVGMGAAIVMVYHVHELASGTGTIALQLGVSASYQLVAALAASLTYGDQVNWLPAVFGDTACKGSSDACEAAATSRRFSIVNTQVPGIWLTSLGLFALAYPVGNRFTNQKQVADFVWGLAGSLFGLVATVAALVLVYVYSDFSGRGAHTDYIMMITIFAIYLSVFWSTYVGTLIYVVAFVVEEVLYVDEYGANTLFSHLTHVTLILCASILILHILLQTVAFFRSPKWLQRLIGLLTTAGSSLAVLLYCASACMLMINNGSMGDLQNTDDGARFSLSFIYQHFIPVFIWAPLYTCRCEIQLLDSWWRIFVWVAMLPVDLIVYAICLAVLSKSPPAANVIDMDSIWGCVVGAGVVPWLAASSV